MLQNLIDMRKRLKGPPQGGVVSIVVTDIQGFSDLMKRQPELTVAALLIHNNLLQKAKWDNFGSIIEQEGGECMLGRDAHKPPALSRGMQVSFSNVRISIRHHHHLLQIHTPLPSRKLEMQ